MKSDALPTLEQTTALIQHRRTIKPVAMDSTRPVDRQLLLQLLENGTWAPSHGLTEPWRFFVFEGPARQRLASALQANYQQAMPPAEFREDKFRKLGETPLLAPVVVVCAMERRGGDKIPELEEIEAVAAALQNLMLSATAAGLGAFWATSPVLEVDAFKTWLGLRMEDRCLALMYVGWPKEGLTWPRSSRQPVETKVSWHSS